MCALLLLHAARRYISGGASLASALISLLAAWVTRKYSRQLSMQLGHVGWLLLGLVCPSEPHTHTRAQRPDLTGHQAHACGAHAPLGAPCTTQAAALHVRVRVRAPPAQVSFVTIRIYPGSLALAERMPGAAVLIGGLYLCYAAGRAVWESTNRFVSASLFPANLEEIFALIRFGEGLAATTAFLICPCRTGFPIDVRPTAARQCPDPGAFRARDVRWPDIAALCVCCR